MAALKTILGLLSYQLIMYVKLWEYQIFSYMKVDTGCINSDIANESSCLVL